ncbi:MAG: amidophosphoribosyltransferase [Bacteroidia bacterium]|nr:amidophosphoribosyltransferase [Bacteroidia bacterium]
MSDQIKHECGIGLLRLLKPLEYYQEKYGSALWGLNKMYLLMEKQKNRGQDGAGLATVKLNARPGRPYLHRIRNNHPAPWTNIFKDINDQLKDVKVKFPDSWEEGEVLKQHFDWAAEVMLGHLRYGTHGSYGIEACHPVIRPHEYPFRSLAVAGNFNLTNVDYLFQKLVELGQHPRYQTDTETILERISHFLDVAAEHYQDKYKESGYTRQETAKLISTKLSVTKAIKNAAKVWDGGYVIGGIIGNGDAFVLRDPNGIRPCYFYYNDEFLVAASERSAISTIFNLDPAVISELPPAHVLSIKAHNNQIRLKEFTTPGPKLSCSFERIYFSRGVGAEIYQERKRLGAMLAPKIIEALDGDLENTVFDFIPNTAESAYLGMVKEMETYLNARKVHELSQPAVLTDPERLRAVINQRPRVEKVIIKDVKMRTFIADDSSRDDMVAHVYDITHGAIIPGQDTLVCLDDSIVRGTTLQKSILRILARLSPRKIIIVSSAPQIRYPDCYGIDMSQIERLVAFQAAIELLRDRGMEDTIERVYRKIVNMRDEGTMSERNVVAEIYAPFTEDEISEKITEIVKPANFTCELEVIFQPLENLARAIPNHRGDWYFSGNYPTPGGNRIVNQAYLNYYEGRDERSYQSMVAP